MRIIHAISRILGVAAATVVGLIGFLTVLDVFLRFAFRRPIIGTAELTEVMMVVALAFGVAVCAVKGRHVAVSIVVDRFSPRIQAAFTIVTHLAGMAMCLLIAWQTFKESLYVYQYNMTITPALPVPKFPFYWALVLGLIILCLVMGTQVLQQIGEVRKR